MRTVFGNQSDGAIDANVQSGNEKRLTVQSDSENESWFSEIAKTILGKDAGFQLHLITGLPERSCYRYASGERSPPGYFLRILLHSEQGEPFLRAIMGGCRASWWVDLNVKKRCADAYEAQLRDQQWIEKSTLRSAAAE
jgi:hypothetical protein